MKKTILVAVMAVVIAAPGCGPDTTSSTGVPNPPFIGSLPQDPNRYEGEPGVYGGTLVLSIPDDIKTFNITLASDNATADVLWLNVFRCPVDYRNAGDKPGYDPGLCTRWEVSPDQKQWTLYLRQGVLWSDGQPFTADDVIFTYAVTIDEKVISPGRDIFIDGTDAGGNPIMPQARKLDDYTVQFNLNRPDSNFLDAIYNLWLIPKHKWEAAWRSGAFRQTMKLSDDPAEAVGLGPFRIKEYVSGQRVVLERNPYFWKVDSRGQRLPYLDRIVFVIAKDFDTLPSKFEAGELDMMPRVRPQDYGVVKRMEGLSVKVEDIGVSYDPYWLAFNENTGRSEKTGKPYVEPWKLRLFRDRRFRQAVSFAIDRDGLANTVFAARAVPIYSFVSPADSVWYSDDIAKYPFDPQRAKQMLAEIGLHDTNGDGLLEDSDGHTIEFSINTNASNSQRVETAAFIASNLRDVGIKANSSPVTMGAVADMMEKTFVFDAIVLGWQVNPPPGPTNSKNILLSSGAQHACFAGQKKPSTEWEARIDFLIRRIEEAPELSARQNVYAEVQRIWSEELPEINLVVPREAVAYRSKFGNVHPSALPPRVAWNSEEIYVKR